LESVSSSDLALNLTHAMHFKFYRNNFFSELGFGVNLKYISERLDTKKASAFATDIGLLIKPALPGIRLSFVVQNIGSKMKFINESFSLPFKWKCGFSQTGNTNTDYDYTYSIEAMGTDGETYLLTGFEQVLFKTFSLRVGWQNFRDIGSPLTFGMGFLINGHKTGDFSIDYAYSNYADLGDVHTLSATIKFKSSKKNRKNNEQWDWDFF